MTTLIGAFWKEKRRKGTGCCSVGIAARRFKNQRLPGKFTLDGIDSKKNGFSGIFMVGLKQAGETLSLLKLDEFYVKLY